MTISNQLNLDQNLKLFFLRFSKAVESKNKNLHYQLISDNYYSNSLMNQNKQDLINFLITSLPELPFYKLKLNVDFVQVDKKSNNDFEIYIIPGYEYKLFGIITLVKGVIGIAEVVLIKLEKSEGGLLWITSMEKGNQ